MPTEEITGLGSYRAHVFRCSSYFVVAVEVVDPIADVVVRELENFEDGVDLMFVMFVELDRVSLMDLMDIKTIVRSHFSRLLVSRREPAGGVLLRA